MASELRFVTISLGETLSILASWTVVTLEIPSSGTLKRRPSGTLHHVMTFLHPLTPREGRCVCVNGYPFKLKLFTCRIELRF